MKESVHGYLQTGQTTCHDPSGAAAPCAGSGQNGEFRRERQAALKPHLERVRDNMDRTLAMEEQMQQDLARGRMVSDSDLRHRIRLLGEQVRMLIEMNALALEEAERPDCSNP